MFRLILYIFFLLGHSVLGQEKIKMEIGKQYDPPIMGYNANMAHTPSWEDSIFTNALKKLNPKILRYPGGSNSFYWNWKKGWTKSYNEFYPYLKSSGFLHKGKPINSSKELKEIAVKNKKQNGFWNQIWRYNAKQHKYNTIPSFSFGIKQTEAKAIFCLNLISSSITNEIEMLKSAQENGIKIEYIELGNELNGFSILSQHFYPSNQAYIDTCLKWATEIWKVFPKANIGIIGGDKRINNWNKRLANIFQEKFPTKNKQISFILHYYTHFKKPNFDYTQLNQYKQFIGLSSLEIPQKLNQWNWDDTKNHTTWITEYNIIEKKPHEINNTWAHGLFISNKTHQLLSHTNAIIFNFHNIGSNTFPGSAVLDLINTDEQYLKKTATGIVTSLWNRLTSNSEKLYNINFNNKPWKVHYPSKKTCDCPNNPKKSTTIEFNPIHAYKSTGENQKFLICNTSEKEYQITLTDIEINEGKMEQYSGNLTHDVRGDLQQGETWKVSKKNVKKIVIIPPYSITLIEE